MNKNKAVRISYALLISIFFSAQVRSQTGRFHINGKLIGQETGIMYLSYPNSEGKLLNDSCLLENGSFFFKGKIVEPTLATLKGNTTSINDDDPNLTRFYLEPGNMAVIVKKNHFRDIRVTGSKTQKEFENLLSKYAGIDNKSDSTYDKYSKIHYDFIITHPDSYLSPFLLALYKAHWSLDSVRMLYNQLNPKIKESFYGKEVAKSINKIDDSSVGKTAKPIIEDDINGTLVNLSNFKGKYVLLDFWASWCLPCRQGSPHLINLFKKYHSQGLEIIGIADDEAQPDAWKNAIRKDGINIWYNVLNNEKPDMNGNTDESQSINSKYGIQVLPTKILIDKNGMIIGRYKGTESEVNLDNKLKEIFE